MGALLVRLHVRPGAACPAWRKGKLAEKGLANRKHRCARRRPHPPSPYGYRSGGR